MIDRSKCSVLLLMFLISCSAYKAAENSGVDVSDIKHCKIKSCILSKGMEILDKKLTPEGQYIETYRGMARKSGLNYVRSAGHGILSVGTLGLWEVVGTPVEGAISNNRGYIVARAVYKNDTSDNIESLEIFDASGKKVK